MKNCKITKSLTKSKSNNNIKENSGNKNKAKILSKMQKNVKEVCH